MSRVLFIGAGSPWKGCSGHHVRQMMLLEAARQLGPVGAVLYDDGLGHPENSPTWIDPILWKPRDESTARLRPTFWQDILDPVPRMLRGRVRESKHDQALSFIQSYQPNIILAYRIEFLVATGIQDVSRVYLDIDDPEHIRRSRAAALRSRVDWRTRLDLFKLRFFEKRVARSVRMRFVCNDHDAMAFRPKAVVVPNAIPLPDVIRRPDSPGATVLFVGNLTGNGANADGLRWFVNSVWPVVRSAAPQLRLRVVGKYSDLIFRDLSVTEGVEFAGFVEDISREYFEASVAIAPIRYGTGTRIKILEAMAHGCPVISTSAGSEGIDASPGKNILIANDADSFSLAIVRMATEVDFANTVGMAGRDLVECIYSSNKVAQSVARIIRNDTEGMT